MSWLTEPFDFIVFLCLSQKTQNVKRLIVNTEQEVERFLNQIFAL